MKRYGKIAGIAGVRVSPHTLRHTAAVSQIALAYKNKKIGNLQNNRCYKSKKTIDRKLIYNNMTLFNRINYPNWFICSQ